MNTFRFPRRLSHTNRIDAWIIAFCGLNFHKGRDVCCRTRCCTFPSDLENFIPAPTAFQLLSLAKYGKYVAAVNVGPSSGNNIDCVGTS